MFKVLRLVGRLASCCVGCFCWPVVFWRRRLACGEPNEDRQVELRPVLGRSTPADGSREPRTCCCRFPRRLRGRQRASPTSANTEPAAWCRPRGALGGGSRGWRGCKTSAGTHRRRGMRWGSLFSLDSVVKARPHEFAMLFCSIWHPGRAVEGGKGTRWPPIPQCGEGRARLTFTRPSIIVNRLSSRLVVMTGAQSGSRFISFWRRVRAA